MASNAEEKKSQREAAKRLKRAAVAAQLQKKAADQQKQREDKLKREDEARADAKGKAIERQQAANAAAIKQDQLNQEETERQLADQTKKLLERAKERAKSTPDPAHERVLARLTTRVTKIAQENRRFTYQVMAYRSNKARAIFDADTRLREKLEEIEDRKIKDLREIDEEELRYKDFHEKNLVDAEEKKEDQLDDAEFKHDKDLDGVKTDAEKAKVDKAFEDRKKDIEKAAEKEKEEIDKKFQQQLKILRDKRDDLDYKRKGEINDANKEHELKLKDIDKTFKQKLRRIFERRRRPSGKSEYRVDQEDAPKEIAWDEYDKLVAENETDARATNAARRSVTTTHNYIKKLIGIAPWIERLAVGKVLSFDKTTHRCVVQIGSSPAFEVEDVCETTETTVIVDKPVTSSHAIVDANGQVTGVEQVTEIVKELQLVTKTVCHPEITSQDAGHTILSDVMYGVANPKVGNSYTVHIPGVYKDKDTHYNAGRPWIRVPEGGRWIYRKSRNDTHIVRYPWPPPGKTEKWEFEVVNDKALPSAELFGSSTPKDSTTQIVLRDREFGKGAWDGPKRSPLPPLHHLYHYEEMGFGKVVYDWVPDRPYITPNAIANDGVTTAGNNIKYDSRVMTRFNGSQMGPPILLSHYECSQVGLDGLTYTIAINNYGPNLKEVILDGRLEDITLAARGWQGKLASFEEKVNITNNYFTKHTDYPKQPPLLGRECTGSGCHWALFDILFWDSYECHDVAFENPIHFFFEQVLEAGRHVDESAISAFGAWEYDGKPASVHLWFEREAIVVEPSAYNFVNQFIKPKTLIKGTGCKPDTDTIVAEGVGPGMTQVGHAALDEDRNIILMGTKNKTAIRWTVKDQWKTMPIIERVLILSRDGQEALGEVGSGSTAKHYVTLDGGDTWEQCATLPELDFSVVKFVDEL